MQANDLLSPAPLPPSPRAPDGEIVQRWREATGAKLLKWPRDALERWGGWFLFGLFAAILVWCAVPPARRGCADLTRCRQTR